MGHHGDAGEELLDSGPIAAPDLIGMSPQDARRTAHLAEIDLILEEHPAERGLRGRVFRQDPAPGARVRPGDVIDAWVGARPGVAVPDVEGVEEQDALAALRSAGLYPSRRVVRRSRSVPQGLIIRTRPRAGTAVPIGTRVTYVVASQPRARASDKREARRAHARQVPGESFISLPVTE